MAKVYGKIFAGHGIRGPGVDLLHLEESGTETHVALEFHEEYASHSSLTKGFASYAEPLKSLNTTGIATLTDWHSAEGTAVYETGKSISVRELTRAFRKLDKPAGEKAGLELLIGVCSALASAQEVAQNIDLACHGFLSPWTIFIRDDGTPLLIAYGVPAAPLFAFIDQQADNLSANAVKYCPPERLENLSEDMSSDLQSLALVISEVMTGEWVYDGKADEVLEQIITGKAPNVFEDIAQDLSDATFELLSKALEPKISDRFSNANDLLNEAKAALAGATGMTLAEAYAETLTVGIRDDLGFETVEAPAALPTAPQIKAPEVSTPTVQPKVPVAISEATSNGPPGLANNASLKDIYNYANELVAKADELITSIDEKIGLCSEHIATNPAVLTPILDEIESASRRAKKAAKSTRSSVSLVELDENVSDARTSLELVTSSFQQVEAALQEVTDGQQSILENVRQQKAEAQAIEVAHGKADDCTAQAHKAWQEAQDTTNAFQTETTNGTLASPGIDALFTAAGAATESARIATADAAEAAQNAGSSATAAEAQDAADIAHAAAGTARKAAVETNELLDKARKMALKAIETVLEKLAAHSTLCNESLSRATQAVHRADQALQVGPTAEASRLRDQAAEQATLTQGSCDLQKSIGERAQSLNIWNELLDAIKQSNEQNSAASESSDQAVSFSDQIIALAGEAAAEAAALSKATDDAKRIVERIESLTEQGREEVDELVTETEGITDRTSLNARSNALENVGNAEVHLTQLRNQLAQVEGQKLPESASLIVEEMKATATTAEATLKTARKSIRESMEAAERELESLKKDRAHQNALNAAIDKAKGFTDQCDSLVSAAWEAYNGASEELKTTSIARAIDLRAKAHEIIDIADYQAKEAAVAARQAAEQTEPSDAASYADTARSFAERIVADLPEAHAFLEEAEELATREVRQLRDARKQTEVALTAALDHQSKIQEAIEMGTAAAADWMTVATVATALTKLKASTEGLKTDINELTYARDRAAQVDEARQAQEVVPTAKTTLQRAEAKLTASDSALQALRQAVTTAEQEETARKDAHLESQRLGESAQLFLNSIEDSAKALQASISEHQATGEPIKQAQNKMLVAQQTSAKAMEVIKASINASSDASSAAQANQLLAKVREALKQIENSRDNASKAQSTAIDEASREASDRVAAKKRRLENAHTSSKNLAELAKRHLTTLSEKLAETKVELDSTSSGDAKSLQAKAQKTTAIIEEQLGNILNESTEILANQDAASAEKDTGSLTKQVDTLAVLVKKAMGFLNDAVDEARSAAADEEALDKIRAEAAAMVGRMQEEIDRAKGFAKEVEQVVAEAMTEATKAISGQSADPIEGAEKASLKLQAALPMLENADSVAVAQGILKTCRKALGRATECANTNAGLVQEAKQKLQLERENAAKALADARRQAQAPAEQAQAAAKKAQGWLEAGEQEASDYDGEAIKGGIEALKLSATAVGTQANQVAEIAIDASLAGSIEEAAEVETRVIEAVAITMGIAKKTREALETLRAAIQQQKDNQVQIEALQVASAQHTTETEKVKEVIQGTLTLLRELLKATEHSSEHLIGLNKQAETIEQRINEVVGQSLAHTTAAVEGKTLESVTTSVEQAKSSFEEAINLLEQVVKLDTQCREEIKKLTVEAEEQAQQAREDARKERENAREAKEKERQAVREAGTQAFPINRRSGSGTDRKARFEQAKAERESRREGGGNLRDRLKASRGRNAGGERPERPAGRRAGASDRIRRSPRPSGERGPQRGISRRPSRPTEETPEPAPDLQLPPEDPENDETVATPRRRLQRRSDTETRDRPSRTERGPRRERRPRDPESESVPAAEAPTEPGRPQRSRSADDLLARMKKKHDPKG